MRPVLGGADGLDCGGGIESSVGEVEAAAPSENPDKSATASQRDHQPQEQGERRLGDGGDHEGVGNAAQQKQKVEMLSLGGRTTATHRKISKMAGSRPRMVADAVRNDMLDCINHFVSQVRNTIQDTG